VQHKLSALSTQAARLAQQFDQVQQELTSANQRLKLVNSEASQDLAKFNSMRSEVGKIAATAYENGSLSSSTALLTSGDPQEVLDQSSILVELSSVNRAQMSQFIAAARLLTQTRQTAQRTRQGIAQLKNGLVRRRDSLNTLIAQQKSLLAQLTPAQQAGVGPGTPTPAGGGTPPPKYTGPTSSQAEKAVQFAYAQLGKPYVFGASGPDSYDCSGLTMAAWAYAGVSIPRVSYAQMSDLPAVSTSDLEPGDILGFIGNGHVGIYVGGGYLIDAPHTGLDVEKVALSGWYSENLDGAVRP
jgi:cell wall-associated NlpC family hydrolase